MIYNLAKYTSPQTTERAMPIRLRRRLDATFKAKIALEALRDPASVAELARRHKLHPNQIYTWRKTLKTRAPLVFKQGAQQGGAREIEELHAKIGQLTMERDHLAKRRDRFTKIYEK